MAAAIPDHSRPAVDADLPPDVTRRPAPLPLVGGLLAGGASRRMGRAKAGVPWKDGQRLGDVALAALEATCDRVVILGHGEGMDHRPDLPRVADLRPGEGPVAGIEALLASGLGQRYLICPCDQPFVDAALFQWLLDACAGPSCAPLGPFGGPAPFPFCIDAGQHSAVEAALNAGVRSVRRLLIALDVTLLPPPNRERDPLQDVDTPEDLARARDLASGGG